jgi:hypothetical protein
VRRCLIWSSTAATLRALAQTTSTDATNDGPLFASRLDRRIGTSACERKTNHALQFCEMLGQLAREEASKGVSAANRALRVPMHPGYTHGVLAKFAALARPADEGAVTG